MTDLKIILLKGKFDVEILKRYTYEKIYALDYYAHEELSRNLIVHDLADEILTENMQNEIFDKAVSLYNWHELIPNSSEFDINGLNCLSMVDTLELHSFFVNFLYDFIICKKIIEKINPKKIIVSHSLKNPILSLNQKHNFEYEILKSGNIDSMVYDKIEIKLNLGKFPISLKLSRKKYMILKKFIEKILHNFYNLQPDRISHKKSILFMEMNPIDYELLIRSLSQDGIQVIFLNNRRPATWNRKSVKILNENKCKVIDLEKTITEQDKKEIELLSSKLKNKIQTLKNSNVMSEIFTFDGVSFWHGIKDELLMTFEQRLCWYVMLVTSGVRVLTDFNIKQILSLNVVGETEKTILSLNKNKISSIMIEHAFSNYISETSCYDVLSMYSLFKDRIALWGGIQKSYLINQHNIKEENMIISGSPRHDIFFDKDKSLRNKSNVTILITPRPIIETTLHKKINLYKQYEKLLEKIIKHLGKIENVKVMVKMHPGIDSHNSDIKKIIKKINPSIPIYQNSSIKELIEESSVLINITPEGFDLSTVTLESIILGVPVLNIILDNKIYDFEINKMDAILNVFDDNKLEMYLDKLISDEDLRTKLIGNGQKFLQMYMSNMGTASEYLAREIKNSLDIKGHF